MDQMLVYADSLSWGIIPDTRLRLTFTERWPGVFEQGLNARGHPTRVIENCLNGRRSVWEDPFKAGRNGSEGLAQVMEMHAPLRLVLLMLATNDFQRSHDNNAWLSAQGVARLVQIMRQAPIEPGMPVPDILLIAPPLIGQPKGAIAGKFAGADRRCQGLVEALREVAREQATGFFDANRVIRASPVDGIHLDAAAHRVLGEAIATEVAAMLNG
ncbi:SGNH/GDSL hydrolase family protein [Sedimenticola hydrogenitrophicus]|uniref:SGNH/GDSL hydrolase family protein n=1 Tax=Sedimenticola hydrogenitrophicus TaxID=2967975 RepID=UPI0021A28AAA|nr:SGNH/GDSL hydrolase family protein [Sedimenticola hydrogenitrophicus]